MSTPRSTAASPAASSHSPAAVSTTTASIKLSNASSVSESATSASASTSAAAPPPHGGARSPWSTVARPPSPPDGSWPASLPFTLEDYQYLWGQHAPENIEEHPLKVVVGALPSALRGTYFLNGPGILKYGEGANMHPFDGHGYIRRFTFSGREEGKAPVCSLKAKYVETTAFQREDKAGKTLYRGVGSMPNNPRTVVGTLQNMKSPMQKVGTCVCDLRGEQKGRKMEACIHTWPGVWDKTLSRPAM